MSDWLRELRNCRAHRLCLVGMGNRDRGDDAFGVLLAERLAGNPALPCLDAGTAPENRLEAIVACTPDRVVFADAVRSGRHPGAIGLFSTRDARCRGFSTHAVSPAVFERYLALRLGREVAVSILGVEPADTGFGRGLSPAVAAALDEVAAEFEHVFRSETAGADASPGTDPGARVRPGNPVSAAPGMIAASAGFPGPSPKCGGDAAGSPNGMSRRGVLPARRGPRQGEWPCTQQKHVR